MSDTLELVRAFFQRLPADADVAHELRRYDQKTFQFRVEGEAPYVLKIAGGEPSVESGEVASPNVVLETDRDGIKTIFVENRMIDLLMNSDRLLISGTRKDRAAIAWLSRLIRLGFGEKHFAPGILRR